MKNKKRLLFLRVFLINLLVISVSLLLISSICYYNLYSFLRSDHENSILNASQRAYDLTMRTIELDEGIEALKNDGLASHNYNRLKGQISDNYRNSLATIATGTNYYVMRMRSDGEILFRYADIKCFQKDVIHPVFEQKREFFNVPPALSALISGNDDSFFQPATYDDETFYVSWGTLGNTFNETTLTVIKPVYVGGQFDSALMFFIPAPQINSFLHIVTSNFLIAALISLAFSMFLSYILSFRITKPLKEMNVTAMRLASGDFTKRVSTSAKDTISEISELVDTFNDMADSIQNSEENHRSFTSSIAHELRTPMTSIMGFLESILDGTIPPEKSREYLEICLSESKRLSRLVNELMDLSKIESGVEKLNIESFDINECIRRQLIKYQDKITEKNISVSLEFDTEKCLCLCDKDAITRVFINLIDNAIKFTNTDGFINIDVKTHLGKTYVSIENSGQGIEEEDIKHIFDKFYKSDKSRSLDKLGIGLGLYLVKNIMVLHEETIEAKSVPGEYTRFTFTLKNAKSHK